MHRVDNKADRALTMWVEGELFNTSSLRTFSQSGSFLTADILVGTLIEICQRKQLKPRVRLFNPQWKHQCFQGKCQSVWYAIIEYDRPGGL